MDLHLKIRGIVSSNMDRMFDENNDDIQYYADKIITKYKQKLSGINLNRYDDEEKIRGRLTAVLDNYDLFYDMIGKWIVSQQPKIAIKNKEKTIKYFNKKIGETMELLELSGNPELKKPIKKKMWDLMDCIQENS